MLRILTRGNLAGVPPDPSIRRLSRSPIDPRSARLAHFIRSMAKAMIGSNKIGHYDWRGLAVEASKPRNKKGVRK